MKVRIAPTQILANLAKGTEVDMNKKLRVFISSLVVICLICCVVQLLQVRKIQDAKNPLEPGDRSNEGDSENVDEVIDETRNSGLTGIQEDNKTIFSSNSYSIAVPNTWCDQILVNPNEGADDLYWTDETLFSVFHKDTYNENGLGWLFSICRYNWSQYQEKYLYSESRQYIFARDDTFFYCALFPSDMQTSDTVVHEYMEDIRYNEAEYVFEDMITRNNLINFTGSN